MKILRKGHKSIHDGSVWTPGRWREEPNATKGDAYGVGLHSIICGDPLKSPVFCWPCEVWADECEDELGRDKIKARYRRQRIVEEITDRFPVIVKTNAFIRHIPKVRWFKPTRKKPPEWMRVERFASVDAARAAAGETASAAAGETARAVALAVARAAAWDAERAAAWVTARAVALAIVRAAAGEARAILVSDLDVDTTWLHRWWQAWDMGYYPIREDGVELVVGKIG
jgi:hypothetical protein